MEMEVSTPVNGLKRGVFMNTIWKKYFFYNRLLLG